MAEYLNRAGDHYAIYANIETGQALRAVIELKLLYTSLETTLADGLAQTWAYADTCGADEAHLVIFDRTPGKPWAEKIWQR